MRWLDIMCWNPDLEDKYLHWKETTEHYVVGIVSHSVVDSSIVSI